MSVGIVRRIYEILLDTVVEMENKLSSETKLGGCDRSCQSSRSVSKIGDDSSMTTHSADAVDGKSRRPSTRTRSAVTISRQGGVSRRRKRNRSNASSSSSRQLHDDS